MLSSRINPLNTTRYWTMLETWFLHMLSSFGSEIFQRWSHVHSTCRSRDNFWVTSDPVEDTGDNIVFRIIDLLLVKLKWWQILRLTWLSCAISSEKMDLWVTCDRLVFKGYNLKWRNTRRMFYNSIVLDHMFYKILIWCFRKQFLSLVQHKDRPQVGQVTNILWSAPSFLQNCIACASRWIPAFVGISFCSDDTSAFRLLVLLKGKDYCRLLYLPINDFATTILKSSKEIELPSFVYTMWLFAMAMSMRSKNTFK